MPPELKEVLELSAKMNSRSLNAEMVSILDKAMETMRYCQKTAKDDPLASVYLAANVIDEYIDVIRAAVVITKLRSGELDINDTNIKSLRDFAPDAIDVGFVADKVMSDEDRRLAEFFRNLTPEARKAMLVLFEGKQ